MQWVSIAASLSSMAPPKKEDPMTSKIIIEATRLVPIEDLHHDDTKDGKDLVQGTYVVEVGRGSYEAQVEAALDTFHSSVPVSCLEYYSFDVRKFTSEDESRDDIIKVEPFDPKTFIEALNTATSSRLN
jgi:hypothetical protein